jgi:hypothetical protein
MVLALLTLALAAPAPMAEANAEEEAILAQGLVAVRFTDEGSIIAWVDVAATPELTLDAVLDIPARAGDIESLEKVELYKETTETAIYAKYFTSLVGFDAVFHIEYAIDRSEGYAEYKLDHSQDNDLGDSWGSYQVYEHGAGTRMVYRSTVDGGVAARMVKKAVLSDSLPEQMLGMKRRAEAN